MGELRASHSMMLSAPSLGGDALQLTHVVHTGQSVKKGDVVFEFDPSEQLYKLEQNRSELEQAEQEITKAQADAAVLAAQDQVTLLKDRYSVRRAELDVQKNELLSKIDGEKNELALAQAKRVLAEQEKDIESHKASGQAATYLAQEKYNKAKLGMDQAQQNLEKMRVTAPMDGLVSIQKNVNVMGGIMFTGMFLPDYREGDQVEAGASIAQVVDPQGLDLTSKISEQDRSNVFVGQPVRDRLRCFAGTGFSWNGKERRRNERARSSLLPTPVATSTSPFNSPMKIPAFAPASQPKSSFSEASKRMCSTFPESPSFSRMASALSTSRRATGTSSGR